MYKHRVDPERNLFEKALWHGGLQQIILATAVALGHDDTSAVGSDGEVWILALYLVLAANAPVARPLKFTDPSNLRSPQLHDHAVRVARTPSRSAIITSSARDLAWTFSITL